MAQLQYQTQRLRGWGGNLSRQAGGQAAGGEGIGGRGPGETKLETDRRRIQAKMAKLRRELASLRTARDTKKAKRRRNAVPAVSIAGYTNAGKSSLLNRLTGAGRARRGRAVRHPRPHHPAHPDVRRPHLHAVRHRRVRPAPAAPAGGGVPLHAGGGRRVRPRAARRRRLAPRPGGPDRGRARGVRSRSAPPRCPRSSSSTRPTSPTRWSSRTSSPGSRTPSSSARTPARASTSCCPRSRPTCRGPATLVDVVVPYSRGDLLSQVHETGEIESLDHAEDGTHIVARVSDELAHQLNQL